MTDDDIEYLQDCLKLHLIVWYAGRDGWRRIAKVNLHPEEDAPVGYFEGLTGQYAALENVDPRDIMVTSPALNDFPSCRKAKGGT